MDDESFIRFVLIPALQARLHQNRSRVKWFSEKVYNHRPKDQHPRVDVRQPVEGTQHCETSPTKLCWYDDQQDSAWDFCVLCGEPHERK